MGHEHDDNDDEQDPEAVKKRIRDIQQGSELFLEIIRSCGKKKLSARAIFSITTHMMAMLEEFSPYTRGSLIDHADDISRNPAFTLITEKELLKAGYETKSPCRVCDQRHGFISDEAEPDETKPTHGPLN